MTKIDAKGGLPGSLSRVLAEIAAERAVQNDLWGGRGLPDGVGGPAAGPPGQAARARAERDEAAGSDALTWRHVLTADFLDAVTAAEPDRLRAALVRLAAVSVTWTQTLDRRSGLPPDAPMWVERNTARAILLDGDEIVLIRRTRENRPPYWVTPGGGVEEHDADLEATLRRELDEELGATVGPVRHVFSSAEHTPGLYYLSTYFLCRVETMDVSRRHGPEFDDPTKGAYDVERVRCDPAALARLQIVPAALADYLRMHAAELPSMLG